jgi:hypothetical protein
MRTLGLLLMVVCFVGCQKSQELPNTSGQSKNVKTIEFAVTSDSLNFTIPLDAATGAKEITIQGKLTTSLSPDYSSYVMLTVQDSVVWHSSFMDASVDFCTKDLKGLVSGSGINCTLEFYNITDVHGPFCCAGSITVCYSD